MERRAIAIRGTVQGVGFRPFVYGLASELCLCGFVRNDAGGVQIEIEGDGHRIDQFLSRLTTRPPPLARIDEMSWEPCPPCGERAFRIEPSRAGPRGGVCVSPDVATCDDCLAEMFNPSDRWYRYPFLNCTNCGPRLTIVKNAPYDRERTTMASFPLCAACRREYEDPADRRFHAQPTACPACGPRLGAVDTDGQPVAVQDPLAWFVEAIRAGQIGAMKGLGGYHLVCDAGNEAAVAALRRRKHRDEKPFAVMVRDSGSADALCELTNTERELLLSNRRPIVLLRRRQGVPIADAVAPDNPLLGVMLPYTPLHHLLLREMNASAVVMTSGNRSDEPIAYREPEAFERLRGIADVYLTHDRPIHVRCDDSVTRIVNGRESPIRRSRGYAPQPIALPVECPEPIVAVGGQLKATFALGRGRQAVLSHHLGDLDHFQAYRAFEKDLALYERLFELRPTRIAHDLHPDYASTRYALNRQTDEGVSLIGVQHHHAHMASCMAENGLDEPVIGVTFDGTGYGTDGAIWGGEFLVGDYAGFERAARLRYVRMPGGEQAVREPWRMALAHLADAGCDCPSLDRRLDPPAVRTVRRVLQSGFNAPPTSSAGRLFDAVAALVAGRDRVSFEGQAAMELERLAEACGPCGSFPFDIVCADENAAIEVDTRPLVRAVAADVNRGEAPARIARRFHSTLAGMIGAVCERIRADGGPSKVVLSGGVFMNALLTREAGDALAARGFDVYCHRLVPPNDGGLSLGQVAVAARTAVADVAAATGRDPCVLESPAR